MKEVTNYFLWIEWNQKHKNKPEKVGGRKDYKIDCIASEFKAEYREMVETKRGLLKTVSWRIVTIPIHF